MIIVFILATWCGPCRLTHGLMAPIKEELAAKGVDFVYLSLSDSDMEQMKAMIKDISGEHYVISLYENYCVVLSP